jgi:hypothetical protein
VLSIRQTEAFCSIFSKGDFSMAELNEDLRPIRRSAPTGDPHSATFNMLYGPNHFGSGDLVPINQDTFAYVFFTKPNLNLSKRNVARVRKLHYLLDDDPNSLGCAVRCMLSPTVATGTDRADAKGVRSKAINDEYPFIPFLSSSLESLTGWPDEAMEFFESEEGWAKEVYAIADGRPESYGTFNLQAVFNSKEGDPHTVFFSTLQQYMGRVATGEIDPWPISENEFEKDYEMNCYVILTDRTKKYVQKIASLGGGFVVEGATTGANFNINKGPSIQLENNQINVPLKCQGFRYNDPIIIENFNSLVAMFKPSMQQVQDGEIVPSGMVKLSPADKVIANFRGYPYINPNTAELEWWLEEDIYNDIINTTQGENNG